MLSLNPKMIVADEPVSALDVSIQAQVINLLEDLQEKLELTYLFIAHDLAVVQFSCDVVAVMYMGKIVEQAPVNELFNNPLHPYTIALMSAIPKIKDPNREQRQRLKGEVPDMLSKPGGCPFNPRCPFADEKCRTENPVLRALPDKPEHLLACGHR